MKKTKRIADPTGRKNLKSEKAFTRRNKRIEGYEETCKHRTDNGRGFRRPGSLKVK